jgi:hypothetical protein
MISMLHKRAAGLLGAAVLLASPAWANTDPAGHWEGRFNAGDREIGLSLDLAKGSNSEWIASMGIPAEHVTGLVVMNVAVDGKSVRLVAVELMMAKVDLTLDSDGTMKGTLSNRGDSKPIEFKRIGEARVELIPACPAVSTQLEGDWEGSLQTPGRPFRIAFHFKNRSDNTVAASIDTPDTDAFGLPLNDVRQTDRRVQAGIRVAHATFEGTLNPEGTELAGQFRHEDSAMPLTLRRKAPSVE